MNRLIIIGNGFDLAHELKTRFSDFVNSYIWKSINQFAKKGFHQDQLITISKKGISNLSFNHYLIREGEEQSSIEQLKKIKQDENISVHTSSFLSKLIGSQEAERWVDIEMLYYESLLETFFHYKDYSSLEKVKELNNQFEFLRNQFLTYLRDFVEPNCNQNLANLDLFESFYQTISSTEVNKKERIKRNGRDWTVPNKRIEKILFVNFNYTSLAKHYADKLQESNFVNDVRFLYLHGSIPENNILFGYGDEVHEMIKEIEKSNKNEFLKHLKSFQYLEEMNYYYLSDFMMDNDFQVSIYGHSCGLSDRTLLKEIFEHDNCCSIKIFYHVRNDGSDDFSEKVFEISRHFDKKSLMRQRVNPKEHSQPIPQPFLDKNN